MVHSRFESRGADKACVSRLVCPSRGGKEKTKPTAILRLFIKLFAVTILASSITSGRGGRVALEGLRRLQYGRSGTHNKPSSTVLNQRDRLFCNAFVTAVPVPASFSRKFSQSSSSSSTAETLTDMDMASDEKADRGECQIAGNRYLFKGTHSQDQSLWIYHLESTTSTMDEAKLLVEQKFMDVNPEIKKGCELTEDGSLSKTDSPNSFLIAALSQSNGRGTSKRNWKSSQIGNALFTIGIKQSTWMTDLKARNDGRMVPLTLLPLKVGSVVAFHIQKFLAACTIAQESMPRVTVKWPNDVLLHSYNAHSQSTKVSHEKVAGILIESSQEWFLIGIGINVGYAPDIPSEGMDYGRKATSLSKYCGSLLSENGDNHEQLWIDASKKLAKDIAFDIHSWLHPAELTSLSSSPQTSDAILREWKSYVDWDMELVLRDTANKEKVILKQVLEDGRVVVEEVETGSTRTLVSDYFL
eukprot:CCRYP_002021-RA/>CCRYP_002021-RA protein AED:0.10 eAED:0.10 QI:0/-1/0/1/-1/1/1/0/470